MISDELYALMEDISHQRLEGWRDRLLALGPLDPRSLEMLYHAAIDDNDAVTFRVLLPFGPPPAVTLERAIGEVIPDIAWALFEQGQVCPLSGHFVACLMDSPQRLTHLARFWPHVNIADHPSVMREAAFADPEVFAFFVERCDLTPVIPDVASLLAKGVKPHVLRRLWPHLDHRHDGGVVLQSLAFFDIGWALAEAWPHADLPRVEHALVSGQLSGRLKEQQADRRQSGPAWSALDALGVHVDSLTRQAWLDRYPDQLPRTLARERWVSTADPTSLPRRVRSRT